MRKLLLIISLFLLASLLQDALAQSRKISGRVISSQDNKPLPGVSVFVKGTPIGTVTNGEGNFELNIPSTAKTVSFAFLSMKPVELPASSENFNVVMDPDVIGVNQVVVTALGISREKKSLGYATQNISGESISQIKNDNFINNLSGKVSGVQIRVNGNMGGSTNAIIRGSSSLTGNNQALFVVDGIPINNTNNNNKDQLNGRSGYDFGNAAADINPNDIESVNVLKGAAATALYGSRAANGVILITTKKGLAATASTKKFEVNVNSNLTVGIIDKSTFPNYQKNYGAGYGPFYGPSNDSRLDSIDIDGDGKLDLVTPLTEDASMGEKFDPKLLVYQWDSFDPASPNYKKKTPWVNSPNGPITFFNNSVSYTNSFDISRGDQFSSFRLGYTNLNATDIMPNSSLIKNNLDFTGSIKVVDKLKVTSSINYINTKGQGRNSTGYSDNIMSNFRQWWQTNVDVSMMKYLYEKTGRNATWNRTAYDDPSPIYWDNLYWTRYKNYETDARNRVIGYVQSDWDIMKDLSIMGRTSVDTYTELNEERRAVGSTSSEFGVGAGPFGSTRKEATSGYARFDRTFMEVNYDLLAKYRKDLTKDINMTALLGSNVRRTTVDQTYASTTGGLIVPDLYSLGNSVSPIGLEELATKVVVNGVFGNISLGYKNYLYFDATLRRDVSSTLPISNDTYYYPSVSGSFLFSEILQQQWLQLGKIRLNYAEVGNDAPFASLHNAYAQATSFNGNALFALPRTNNNPDLKPERTRNIEAGLEMTMFEQRIGFDAALYKKNSIDQIIPVSVSYTTGYSTKYINSGEIENKGVELSLFGTPVKTKNLSWDITINWTKNVNKVISLAPGVENLQLGSLQGGVTINARVGQPYGTIQGTDYIYLNGQRVVDSNGYYEKTDRSDIVLGHVTPDWTSGINNRIRYKDWTFSFLVDWQKGGSIFSLDRYYGEAGGLYSNTDYKNDLGNPVRNDLSDGGGVILEGVQEDGTKNTIRVPVNDYSVFGYTGHPNSEFVYDASYVKLREVVLSYSLPAKWLQKTFIYAASISIVGSNLWIIYKNIPDADPEASQSSGNIQGWQSGTLPSIRKIGASINLKF